jgi:peptidoglycan/xylan/chitin deacetylase (PgdA/CDA1 family)
LFTFHRAAPTEVWGGLPNRDFYLDLGFLDRLLAYVRRTGWAVVTLDEVLARAGRTGTMGRYVNFSVDDCYVDTWREVVPLFRKHGAPVTLFVTTGIPDGTLRLWQAGLETILARSDRVVLPSGPIDIVTPKDKRELFARLSADWDGPEAVEHYAAFCRLNQADPVALDHEHAISWEMLGSLRDDPLVEIGGHTVSHTRISSLSPEGAFEEIHGCRERLRSRLGVSARHFAFPYGRSGDCGIRDFDLVRKAGFASAATTRKGLVGRGQDPFSLPRNTLNGSHRNLAMAEAHLTGFTGFAARVTGRV